MLNNRVILKGNLTKDPEYKTISEKDLVTFRMAVNESIGNGKEETVYLDVDGRLILDLSKSNKRLLLRFIHE